VQDRDVDLVVTATRSDTHAAVNIAGLQAGKHVIAEKPFATSTAEADATIEAARHAAGRLLVRQNRRFDAAFVHIKEILASGKLGDVHLVKLYRHNYQRRADWQTLRAWKGGLMNNWGPHIIDHALRMIDARSCLWIDLKNVAAAATPRITSDRAARQQLVVADIESPAAWPCERSACLGTQGAW